MKYPYEITPSYKIFFNPSTNEFETEAGYSSKHLDATRKAATLGK